MTLKSELSNCHIIACTELLCFNISDRHFELLYNLDRGVQETGAATNEYTVLIFHVVVSNYVWGLDLHEEMNSTKQLCKRGSKNAK